VRRVNLLNIEFNLRDLLSWKKKEPVVLAVDDDANTLELIRRAAENSGYQVEAASTAEEALGILHRNGRRFVVALIDVRLPGMSGWQLRRQILASWPKLRVSVMSGSPQSFENMPSGELLSVLIKPTNFGDFFRSLT